MLEVFLPQPQHQRRNPFYVVILLENKTSKFYQNFISCFVFDFCLSFILTTMGEHHSGLAALHHPEGPKGGRRETFLATRKWIGRIFLCCDVHDEDGCVWRCFCERLGTLPDCIVQLELFCASLFQCKKCWAVVGSQKYRFAVSNQVRESIRCDGNGQRLVRRDL